VREFRDALAKLIWKWREEKAGRWDFEGFRFVDRECKPGGKQSNLFRSAVFPVAASFDCAQFSGDAFFVSAQFKGAAYFNSTLFSGYTYFLSARFSGDADFEGVQFSSSTYFSRVMFSGDACFFRAMFSGDASFFSATFSRDVEFSRATFSGNTDFDNARFSGDTDFFRATFSGNAEFNRATFARLGDFENCAIKGHVNWFWPGTGKRDDKIERGVLRFTNLEFTERGILDLRKNTLQDDCTLEIHECDMRNILLEGTDCTQIKFYDNDWPPKEDVFDVWPLRWLLPLKWRMAKRHVVGDEYHRESLGTNASKPALIRRTYQQLARRFREDYDHPRANEFDRGSFEMRRIESIEQARDKESEESRARGLTTYIGLSFYKYISIYSGSLGLPLIWLGLLWLVCAYVYAILGYNDLVWGDFDVGFMTARLGESFRAAFSFVRDISKTDTITTIKVAQKLFSAILITLFIFSIRRRFKH
jgi:hypothetical protein